MARDQLELLFDVLSERFDSNTQEQDGNEQQAAELQAEKKYLYLPYFMSKLFKMGEVRDISEVDETLSCIKAALVFKGIDFAIIFAEENEEDDKQKGGKKGSR